MYNYIFYVLYKYNLKDGEITARINGCLIAALALFIHLGLIIMAIKKLLPSWYKYIPIDYMAKNKLITVSLFGLFILMFYFYYNRSRIQKIVRRKGPIPEIVNNGWDILKVALLIFIPIIFLFVIGWKRD